MNVAFSYVVFDDSYFPRLVMRVDEVSLKGCGANL